MKTYKLLLLLGARYSFLATILDRPPVDKFTDEEFWQTETQARLFLYSIYPTLFGGFGTAQNPSWLEDVGDDAISAPIQNPYAPNIIPETDGSWGIYQYSESQLCNSQCSASE